MVNFHLVFDGAEEAEESKPAMPSKTVRAATTTKVTRTVNAKLERESIIRRINNSNQSARFKKSILPTQKQLAGPRK